MIQRDLDEEHCVGCQAKVRRDRSDYVILVVLIPLFFAVYLGASFLGAWLALTLKGY